MIKCDFTKNPKVLFVSVDILKYVLQGLSFPMRQKGNKVHYYTKGNLFDMFEGHCQSSRVFIATSCNFIWFMYVQFMVVVMMQFIKCSLRCERAPSIGECK